MATFYAGLIAMALWFGGTVWGGGSPIKPNTYGEAVYAIPALWWVAVQLSGSVAGFVGFVFNKRLPLYYAGTECILQFTAFGILGMRASDGILQVSSSLVIGVPFGVLTLVMAKGTRRGTLK